MLTLFGASALTFMMVMYALERRNRLFVLAFALGCALSSAYGFLAGTWPFGVVEQIWVLIALRRYFTLPAIAAMPALYSSSWRTSSRPSPAAKASPNPATRSRISRGHCRNQTARASRSEATTATTVSASDSVLTPRILTPASLWLFSTCWVAPSEPLSPPDSPLSPLPAVAAGCSLWCWCRSMVEPIANSKPEPTSSSTSAVRRRVSRVLIRNLLGFENERKRRAR